MVDVEKVLNEYGLNKARDLLLREGFTLTQFHLETGLSKTLNRTSQRIYTEAFKILGIQDLPYKEDTQPMRKFKLEFDRTSGNYWESSYITDILISKLEAPILNKAHTRHRYVIGFPKHPKADPVSNQIKAHVVLWELINEQYVPDDHWILPVDNDYTNLSIDNWVLVHAGEYKSHRFSGIGNPMYRHGKSTRHKQGGWPKISKDTIALSPKCRRCGVTKGLIVHHLINYHLFDKPIEAHQQCNLLVLCQSCHAKIHLNNLNIKALIEETQYSKLLELLETLKSQVPESLIEIYRDVEKQLGLTDNQQPST